MGRAARQDRLLDDGHSPATVLRQHRILSRALTVAMQRGHVPRNVATLVDPPTQQHSDVATALDDHSRLAYSELLGDEGKDTAAAFWLRANDYFTACGITVRRVLTNNGNCYRSFAFRDALGGITHKRTRPYRPQTNGKVERFHRTLADEWAYATVYDSDAERAAAYPAWLHRYNHHRGHTALGGQPPASRVTNLSGRNT